MNKRSYNEFLKIMPVAKPSCKSHEILKKKISDLANIYEGYVAFLKEGGFVDESQYLSLLPGCLRANKDLKNTNVFFLCYPSFTAQAREAIRAVLENAKNVIGIFCAGEEELYTNRAADAFARVCAEFGGARARNLGVPLDGEAELLRKGLFNPLKADRYALTDKITLFEGIKLGRTDTDSNCTCQNLFSGIGNGQFVIVTAENVLL